MKPSDSLSGLASIIILSSNPLESTRQCVAALMRFTRRPWELIVVDNPSTAETTAYLVSLRDDATVTVTVIASTTNRGVPAAINQGLKAARGEYLVVLNNNVIVTDSWLDQLIALADMDRASLEKVKGEDITAEDAESKTEESTKEPERCFARREPRRRCAEGEALFVPASALGLHGGSPSRDVSADASIPSAASSVVSFAETTPPPSASPVVSFAETSPPPSASPVVSFAETTPPGPPFARGGKDSLGRRSPSSLLTADRLLPTADRPLRYRSVSSGRCPIMPLHRSGSRACPITNFAACAVSAASGA